MATELRFPDSMPCHNQQVNSTSTTSPESPQPGGPIPDHAVGNSDSKAKLALFKGHTPSSVSAEQDFQAGGGASLDSESSGGSGNCEVPAGDTLLGDSELSRLMGAQLKLLPMNDQIRELQTIIRDKTASRGDFVFSADRLIRLVVEEGLNQLPFKECTVTTPTGYKYEGVKFEKGNCGVSIMRSGEAMEQGLRDCCRSIRIGKILIQSDEETQKAKVYYAKFPPDIYRRKVLLMYPILTGSPEVNQLQWNLQTKSRQRKRTQLTTSEEEANEKLLHNFEALSDTKGLIHGSRTLQEIVLEMCLKRSCFLETELIVMM